jgi:hypothetical protein
MTLPGFLILSVLVIIAILVFLKLGALPGAKARERGHPQADAINILGWFGLVMGGVPWVIALVWAYTRPMPFAAPEASRGVEPPSDTSKEMK